MYTLPIYQTVKVRAKARRTSLLKSVEASTSGLQHDWDNVKAAFDMIIEFDHNDDEEIIMKEMAVENFDCVKEDSVKLILEDICEKLSSALSVRLQIPTIFLAAFEAFEKAHEWYVAEKFNDADQKRRCADVISRIMLCLGRSRRLQFEENVDEINHGFNIFMHHCSLTKRNNDNEIPLEALYESFWKVFHDQADAEKFMDFFEFIQVKSYSEAMCESIGSIMNMATSSGRNVRPENFNKEIYLRFNLPPLHLLMDNFIPDICREEIDVRKKCYIRKGENIAEQLRKFKFDNVSSTIGNFRDAEERKHSGI